MQQEDTISAIATAGGEAGIGIVRISGRTALSVADRIFRAKNGKRLSGGERQRISIARAVLKDAPIILMDEATASLDVENESLIQEALSELIKNKTVVVIAHRMRTIRGADKIVLLNQGEVEAIGTDVTLQKQSPTYRKMLEKSGFC